MLQSNITLLQKIDSNVEQLINKFHNIFEAAVLGDKSREMFAVESLTIETDASTIIRLCEDLLSISRSIKEAWCLNSVKVEENKQSDEPDLKLMYAKFNELTDRIAHFEKNT